MATRRAKFISRRRALVGASTFTHVYQYFTY